jgi:hypothetical membrane protein
VTRIQAFDDRFWLLGPLVWVLAIEYFVVQVVVATAWPRPYDWLHDPISDLGNTACGEYDHRWVCSPRHAAMNLSLIALGSLMIAGAPLIYQEFRERRLGWTGFAGMALAGAGTLVVGLVPENVDLGVHSAAAAAGPLVAGNIALIILSYTLELPRGPRLYTRGSGVVGLIALGFFALGLLGAGDYLGLGKGGMERLAAYPQSLWLVCFGGYMSRKRYADRRRRPPPLALQ